MAFFKKMFSSINTFCCHLCAFLAIKKRGWVTGIHLHFLFPVNGSKLLLFFFTFCSLVNLAFDLGFWNKKLELTKLNSFQITMISMYKHRYPYYHFITVFWKLAHRRLLPKSIQPRVVPHVVGLLFLLQIWHA